MSALGLAHPPLHQVRAIIGRALDEDIGGGDVTTDHSVPTDQRSPAILLAKQDGVLCGVHVFSETLAMVDRGVTVTVERPDGAEVGKGDVVARIEGPTRALLTGERTALNFVQRLSGIATLTAAFAARLRGLPTRLVDTRKTTPGLRLLEKYAVRVGAGTIIASTWPTRYCSRTTTWPPCAAEASTSPTPSGPSRSGCLTR